MTITKPLSSEEQFQLNSNVANYLEDLAMRLRSSEGMVRFFAHEESSIAVEFEKAI